MCLSEGYAQDAHRKSLGQVLYVKCRTQMCLWLWWGTGQRQVCAAEMGSVGKVEKVRGQEERNATR